MNAGTWTCGTVFSLPHLLNPHELLQFLSHHLAHLPFYPALNKILCFLGHWQGILCLGNVALGKKKKVVSKIPDADLNQTSSWRNLHTGKYTEKRGDFILTISQISLSQWSPCWDQSWLGKLLLSQGLSANSGRARHISVSADREISRPHRQTKWPALRFSEGVTCCRPANRKEKCCVPAQLSGPSRERWKSKDCFLSLKSLVSLSSLHCKSAEDSQTVV